MITWNRCIGYLPFMYVSNLYICWIWWVFKIASNRKSKSQKFPCIVTIGQPWKIIAGINPYKFAIDRFHWANSPVPLSVINYIGTFCPAWFSIYSCWYLVITLKKSKFMQYFILQTNSDNWTTWKNIRLLHYYSPFYLPCTHWPILGWNVS